MISRRLSRYFVSPAAGGVNTACVTAATSGCAGVAGAGAPAAAFACSAGAASVLRRAVLGNDEVLGRQPFDRLPVLVLHRNGGDDQAGARAEDRLIRRRARRLLLLSARDDAQAGGQGGGNDGTRQALHQNRTLRLL